ILKEAQSRIAALPAAPPPPVDAGASPVAAPADQQAALPPSSPNAPQDQNVWPLPIGQAVKKEDAPYCANANCVERSSALYGVLCFPDPAASAPPPPTYVSPVAPRELDARALRD